MTTGRSRSLRSVVRPIGRFDDRDPEVLRFSWSGSGFAVRFEGSLLRMRVTGSVAWVRVEVDGLPDILELGSSRDWIEVGGDLPRTEHVVVVRKRTEPLVGALLLRDLETDGRILPATAPTGPKLEFLGDSITCGYGNLAPDETHGFEAPTEDYFGSYAGVAERRLGAEAHCVAWSGRGLVRNFDPGSDPTMAELYGLAEPLSGASWVDSAWIPDVVVVNLGSNDLYRAPPPEPGPFREAWDALVRRILSKSDGVKVVLLDGPLLKDGFPLDQDGRSLATLSETRRLLDGIAARFDPRRVFRLSLTPCHSSRGWGADWHPGWVQHLLNGRELADFLERRVLIRPRP